MSTTLLVKAPLTRGREPGPSAAGPSAPTGHPRVAPGGSRCAMIAAPVLALLTLWAADDGGYDAVVWLAGALAVVALAVWGRLVFGPSRRLGPRGRWAVVALWSYLAWSYASISWASDQNAALAGSNRVLLYAVIFGLFAQLEWPRRRLDLLLLAYLLALGALAAAVLIKLALGPAPQLLQNAQLAAGLGYHNATAALGTIGAAGSILLGSSRSSTPAVRAALAASATACIDCSLLAQSRGWLYTLPVVVAILLAITPARGRVALWALVPVGGALATLPWIIHGYSLADALSGQAAQRAVARADVASARAALGAALLSGATAWVMALAQRRYELSARGRRALRRTSRVVIVTAALVASASVAIATGDGAVARGWHQFTADAPMRPGVDRFVELGSGRYDFWRVALASFEGHPIGGLGQDNFAEPYVMKRHTSEEPAWVHSLEVRLLVHTGAVGLALFAAFLVLALRASLLAARSAGRTGRAAIAVALVPLTVWVIHGSVDWFWELPALSGPAFALLGAAAALEPGRRAAIRGSAARASATVAVVAGGVAAAVLLPAYLGARALVSAQHLAGVAPKAALGYLKTAASLEPLDSAPLVLSAAIELRSGDGARAFSQTQAGLVRDPGSWLLWLEQGLAAGADRRLSAERAALARARALDPSEPVVALAQQRAASHGVLRIQEAAAIFGARVKAKVGA